MQHQSARVIFAGDIKDLCPKKITDFDKSLKQVVNLPTRKGKILDVIITDMWKFYQQPIILPLIRVDEKKKGVPSDHSGVLFIPINNSHSY